MGLMAGLGGNASHGSVLLSSGWLITVEALGDPGHPPSTRLDAVIK